MTHDSLLTTLQIKGLFAQEVAVAGGTVSDAFDDGRHLLVRSVLPWVREVRTKDRVQGGVALKASHEEVWVHPYVFRQVCQNGAIIAHALGSQHLALDCATLEEAATAVCAAVQGCCSEETFAEAAEGMRQAGVAEADLALNLMPLLSRLPAGTASHLLENILHRFFEEPDRSRFALGNAVTAVARDTREPDLRWRLEELGGGILVGASPRPLPGSGSMTQHARPVEAVVA
jgi:hypothetical protein